MRKNFKPQPYMYPQPVLVVAAYGEDGKANAMCAAWGTVCDTDAVALVINADHKTLKNIMDRKAFTVSMATSCQIEQVDYMGMVSGNDEPDKIAKVGWHVAKSEVVDAPLIEELPMALECTVIKYDKKFECLYGKEFEVNSYHHQGLKKIGEGLRVTMRAKDGLAEAFEHESLPYLGVQWHPERMCLTQSREDTVDGLKLFHYFLALCQEYKDED